MKPQGHWFATAILIAVLGLLASGATAGVFHVTVGKYNRQILANQFDYCDAGSCPGCMRTYFADPMNPFDDGDTENCDGMFTFTNLIFHWFSNLAGGQWESFALYTTKETLENTVTHCLQHFPGDVRCSVLDQGAGEYVEITGAYQIGSELAMNTLGGYIDRGTLGYPDGPNYFDWSGVRNYVASARYNPELSTAGPWEVTYYGCLAYWADTAMNNSIPTKAGEKDYVEDFAKKCLAHALVCWQAPEWENGQSEVDILGPNRIDPWPFYYLETPTFVYEMAEALRDILFLPVKTTNSSWGSLKALYR